MASSSLTDRSEGNIFKLGLGTLLPPNEPVECDDGPRGDSRLMTPNVGTSDALQLEKQNLCQGQDKRLFFSRLKHFNDFDPHFHHHGFITAERY